MAAGSVVVDTNVLSWLLEGRGHPLADGYREVVAGRRVLIAFQTVMELRYAALRAGWGELRRRGLEQRLARLSVVQPDDALLRICAELRNACERAGHGLGGRLHDGDRWVAATAIRLEAALVSHDRIFVDAPGVELLTLLEGA